MIAVKFIANYLPKQRKFRVTIKAGSIRISEKMTISKFMRLAKSTDKPLKVGGKTILFDGDEGGELEVRKYLKEVADSYLKYGVSLN